MLRPVLSSLLSLSSRTRFSSAAPVSHLLARRMFSSRTFGHNSSVELVNLGGGVQMIRLNRPGLLNAMNHEMGETFWNVCRHLTETGTIEDLKAVILTGSGRGFSAGGDLDFLLDRCNDTPINNVKLMRKFYSQWLDGLLNLPVPTVAAINGPAIGAGACITLACDMRIAAENAEMGFTFSTLGLHCGMGGSHLLPIVTNQATAVRLLTTGEVFKSAQAKEFGLVSEVLPAAQKDATGPSPVEARAIELARHFASCPAASMRAQTKSLRLRLFDGLERALQREADGQVISYSSPDFKEKILKIREEQKQRAAKKAQKKQ